MIDNPRMQELLDTLLSSHATPEDVCRSCPELLPEIRDRWRKLCGVRSELDALFPPLDESGSSAAAEWASSFGLDTCASTAPWR